MGPGRAPPTVCPALLLTWRVADLLLGRGRPVLRRALHPLTGALAGPVAAALSRQRRPLTRAVVLLALAISFAASTATFNATYAQQAEADAQLTNGADVTVTQAPGTPAPPGRITGIAAVPGVRAVEPVQHRFAYIVTDISTTRQIIGSSLTAVDLTGLTRVELTFALILAAAAGGLVLGLGLAERRRTFAIATALGATRRHLRGMISSEAAVLAVLGLTAGAAAGAVLSIMLVKVLTGVFDPPPSVIAVPWAYLGIVAAVTVLGLAAVTAAAARTARRPAIGALREL